MLVRLLILVLSMASVTQFASASYTITSDQFSTPSPDSLARLLTSDYKTDREKVTSIFKWITENISYNIRPYYNATRNRATAHITDEPEDTGALKPLSERVAIDVLRRRVAFCDGYARLFKTLCDYAGIRSEIITGYADGRMSNRNRFGSNHRWNAVYIDSSWYLLDATWASGHLTYGSNDFIQSYNNYYFLTPAKEFARDHYPEDLQWTLLAEPPYMSEFKSSPFKTHAFSKNNIHTFSPRSGVVEANVGDTLRFEVETFGEKNQMMVIESAFVDSAIIADAKPDSAKNNGIVQGDKMSCTYIVTSSDTEWLTVVFNDEVTMRYKLNTKRNFVSAK